MLRSLVPALALLGSLFTPLGAHAQSRPADLENADHHLIWRATLEGWETSWVRSQGGRSEVIATRPELLLPAGDELWAWRARPVEHEVCDCDHGMRVEFEGACRLVPGGPSVAVDLEALSSERLTPVLEPPVTVDRTHWVGEWSQDAVPVASVGPLLLVGYSGYEFGCGAAHGGIGVAFEVWDLRSGSRVPVIEQLPAAFTDPLLGEAKRQMASWDEGLSDEVWLTAFRPRWVQPGPRQPARLALDWQATRDDCYACSDGLWSSYSRSLQVPGSELPALFEPFAELPAAVARQLPEGGASGVAAIEPAQVNRIAELFGLLPPAPLQSIRFQSDFGDREPLPLAGQPTPEFHLDLGMSEVRFSVDAHPTVARIEVEQRWESSITAQDQDRHIDLRGFLHGGSDWEPVAEQPYGQGYQLRWPEAEELAVFPQFTQEALRDALREEGAHLTADPAHWEAMARRCGDGRSDPCAVVVSRFFVRITAYDEAGAVLEQRTLPLIVPLGC